MDLKHDDRIQFINIQERFKITNDVTFPNRTNAITKYLTFKAKEPKFGIDPDSPDEPKPILINLKVNYEVDPCPSRTSLLNCPMLAPKVAERQEDLHVKLDIRTGCAQRDICRCDLKFGLKEPKSYEVRGEQNGLDLEFEVTNQGHEPAYGVSIVFQSIVDFPTIQGPRGTCKPYNNGTNVNDGFMTECNLWKVKANSETLSTFKFKLPANFTGATDFTIQATLKDNCNGMQNEKNLDEELDFELVYQTDFKVSSVVSKSQIM